ncbi:MAG: ABC transporter substrate-binding protein [Chloroherpetonaceae bacterium]|nr:ABC transporter substrate-binding protein [Chloroherpetonaceae bacterium]
MAGGKVAGGTYRYAELQPLTTLDPVQLIDNVSQHAAHQICELLVDLDPNTLSIVPELAESWEISEDGTIYTFTLRDSVYFHNDRCFPQGIGRKLTAADVKYSFERVCNPLTQTKGFWIFRDKVEGATEYYEEQRLAAEQKRAPKILGVRGFEVLSERRFRIRLTKPFAPFLMTLALPFCYIIPREAVAYYGINFTQHPVGTGPFMFSEFAPNYLKLKRNPRYWQKDKDGNALPYLDEIVLYFSCSESEQLSRLEAGDILEMSQFSTMRSAVLPNSQLAEKYQARFVHRSIPSLSVQFCGMNTALPPFSNPKVRRAFSLAVNTAALSYLLWQDSSYAARSLVPPVLASYHQSRLQAMRRKLKSERNALQRPAPASAFNPSLAKQLLAEAGYPSGSGFPALSLYYDSTNARNQKLADFIKTSLKQTLNLDLTLAPLSWQEHLKVCESGSTPFFLLGWVADYPEPESFLQLLYGQFVPADTSQLSYPNFVRYRNPDFDRLYDMALTALTDSSRYALYAEAEELALADSPLLLLVYDRNEYVLAKEVCDYPLNAMDRRDLKYVWLNRSPTAIVP